MIQFSEFAKQAGGMLDQTNIPAAAAQEFVMIRQWLTDIEQGRLVCVPASELEPFPPAEEADLEIVERPDLSPRGQTG